MFSLKEIFFKGKRLLTLDDLDSGAKGIATLNSEGKVPLSQLPASNLTDVQVEGESVVQDTVARIEIPVKDVKVNGQSIVENKEADLTLPTDFRMLNAFTYIIDSQDKFDAWVNGDTSQGQDYSSIAIFAGTYKIKTTRSISSYVAGIIVDTSLTSLIQGFGRVVIQNEYGLAANYLFCIKCSSENKGLITTIRDLSICFYNVNVNSATSCVCIYSTNSASQTTVNIENCFICIIRTEGSNTITGIRNTNPYVTNIVRCDIDVKTISTSDIYLNGIYNHVANANSNIANTSVTNIAGVLNARDTRISLTKNPNHTSYNYCFAYGVYNSYRSAKVSLQSMSYYCNANCFTREYCLPEIIYGSMTNCSNTSTGNASISLSKNWKNYNYLTFCANPTHAGYKKCFDTVTISTALFYELSLANEYTCGVINLTDEGETNDYKMYITGKNSSGQVTGNYIYTVETERMNLMCVLGW